MLILMSQPANERGGMGDRAFRASKLHRFLSGAGRVYATLRPPPQRLVTLDGQRFHPDRPCGRKVVSNSNGGSLVDVEAGKTSSLIR
jgi:hypothetical protein